LSVDNTTFLGGARPIENEDYERAADSLGVEVPVIQAVAKVESGGKTGFLGDGRPKILFESRWFHKLTDGAFDRDHPNISTPRWIRNYAGGAGEYERLDEAIQLDREAALKSASWGMFQILGVNHRACGFPDAETFVEQQLVSEGSHLDGFVGFVRSNRLDDELRDKRWADFARGYNGPGYAENLYDEKLAEAYAEFAQGRHIPSTADVQQALNKFEANLVVDGVSGGNTRNAIRDFQREAGLPITGIAGPNTLAALGLG
jgi:hypothetical protein